MIEEAIRAAVIDEVDLLVLPELSTSGYYLRSMDEAWSCALPITHPILDRWARLLSPTMTVVVGICESRDDALFNTAVTLGSKGVLGVYRKTHLWDEELTIFTAGHDRPTVIDTPVGRLGVLICYDLEFPEMPRSLAVGGAAMIAVPTNWPLVPKPSGEHAPEVIQAMAAARSSRVAIACCDRRGAELHHEWTQGTSIIGSDGWPTGTLSGDRVDALLAIDPYRTTISPRNNVIHDRRPELY
jgi:predicted amidohydrolase